MAKEREQQQAYYYFVEKQKTAKETAHLIGITEKTMSAWVAKFGWKSEREARALSSVNRAENIQQLIDSLAAERIATQKQLEAETDPKAAMTLRRALASIDDGAAKWNKTLENVKKDGRVRLSVYLDVMEQIFNDLRVFNYKVYMETLDFQEQHVHDVSAKIDRV